MVFAELCDLVSGFGLMSHLWQIVFQNCGHAATTPDLKNTYTCLSLID